MTFGNFLLLTGIIASVCMALGTLFDIDGLRSLTIGDYILIFVSCWVPYFNVVIIFFEGSMVLMHIFANLIFGGDWFKKFINERPFLK